MLAPRLPSTALEKSACRPKTAANRSMQRLHVKRINKRVEKIVHTKKCCLSVGLVVCLFGNATL